MFIWQHLVPSKSNEREAKQKMNTESCSLTVSSVFALCSVYFTLNTEPESFLTLLLHQSPVGIPRMLIRMLKYRYCFKYMRKAYEGYGSTYLIINLSLSFSENHMRRFPVIFAWCILISFGLNAVSITRLSQTHVLGLVRKRHLAIQIILSFAWGV